MEEDKHFFVELLSVGKMNARRIVQLLFYAGWIAIIYCGVRIGEYLIIINNADQRWHATPISGTLRADHYIWGILGCLVFILFAIVIWKVICELLLHILWALKIYVQKHNIEEIEPERPLMNKHGLDPFLGPISILSLILGLLCLILGSVGWFLVLLVIGNIVSFIHMRRHPNHPKFPFVMNAMVLIVFLIFLIVMLTVWTRA